MGQKEKGGHESVAVAAARRRMDDGRSLNQGCAEQGVWA